MHYVNLWRFYIARSDGCPYPHTCGLCKLQHPTSHSQVEAHAFLDNALWREKVAAAITYIAAKSNRAMLLIAADSADVSTASWADLSDIVSGNDCRHLLPPGRHLEVNLTLNFRPTLS